MAVCLSMTYEVQSLSELIIRVFGGERGDSCVGGPFKKAPLIWAVEVIGVVGPRFTSSSLSVVRGTCMVS